MRVLGCGGDKMYVILVYDIASDKNGAKIWRKVYKECKKYLSHVQNSVFEGDISRANLISLNVRINSIIREDADSLIIFKSRNERWLDKVVFGKQQETLSEFI